MNTISPNSTTLNHVGLDAHDMRLDAIQQEFADNCAPHSQGIILNAMGVDISQADLLNEAWQHGWYSPGMGTPGTDIGNLLELHGVPVTRTVNASLADLANELAKGNPVIVGVDSGELWSPGYDEAFEDAMFGPRPDHALLVGGMDFTDDFSHGHVNIIDPGTGDFCHPYDINQFADAWSDSGNLMITIS